MRRALLASLLLALAAPVPATAARFAVGVREGASPHRLAQRIEARTGHPVSVVGPFALAVDAPSARGLASVPGVTWVERIRPSRRLAFTSNDPLLARQWYLDRIRAFDAWPQVPPLAAVRVAVIDSGIDADHPELEDQILGGRSFVASSWRRDTNGHGTFVAGEIAAALNNGQGIAGIGLSAQLLVAKVVRADGSISPEAEARAIRWAVDDGARVINLSFGGVRNPFNRTLDTYSALEAAAVAYAVSNDVLVVAAVGNADEAPEEPWAYASYPAALPHVLGVSAISRDGSVPSFSNRDSVYNDLAAPGDEIFSTLPRALTASSRAGCLLQGYSDCGPPEFRRGEGTSFAAPQVAAAAAVLLGQYPFLQPEQVSAVLTRSAVDATAARGCKRCPLGRDALSGWGVLDVAGAVQALDGPLPEADRYEANDQAGRRAPRLFFSRDRRIDATLDYWDDQIDVYRVRLRPRELMRAILRGPHGTDAALLLWRPGTRRVEGLNVDLRMLAARSKSRRSAERIRFRAHARGWYYLEVKLSTPGAGAYSLAVRKRLVPVRAAPR